MSLKSPVRRKGRLPRALVIGLGVVALIAVALFACQMRPKEPKEPYRLAAVERGDITRSVSASGQLQALEQVDVGSEISGLVERVLVDFNDPVREGQPLAVLDPETYRSRVAQSEAEIEAGVASLRQAEATLANAEADFNRKRDLVGKGIYAPSVLDQATAALKTAQAGVNAAQARIGQSRAQLRSQRVDLGRTTITSPIDGIVIDRKIEPGQTVAASFQAPVLFTIAKNLSKMEVSISVDEADVGQVSEGQPVRFTVDAFPDDTFEGIVTQVRKQPLTEQNVVSYVVIAEADNPGRKLLPGMTANADILLERRSDVLKVPAAALRWTPPTQSGSTVRLAGPAVGGGGGQGADQAGRGAMAGARMVEQLDLDAKQRQAWESIQADLRQAQAAGGSGDRQAMRKAMQENLQQAMNRLEPHLRPDQKTRLAAIRATVGPGGDRASGMRGGVVHVLRDGEPTPVPVRVGATDGSSTEIAGPLQPGDEVVVGGGPRPKAELRSAFGGSGGGRGSRFGVGM